MPARITGQRTWIVPTSRMSREELAAYLERQRCQVELLPTPEVIPAWNQAEGAVIAMLHVTC